MTLRHSDVIETGGGAVVAYLASEPLGVVRAPHHAPVVHRVAITPAKEGQKAISKRHKDTEVKTRRQ